MTIEIWTANWHIDQNVRVWFRHSAPIPVPFQFMENVNHPIKESN